MAKKKKRTRKKRKGNFLGKGGTYPIGALIENKRINIKNYKELQQILED